MRSRPVNALRILDLILVGGTAVLWAPFAALTALACKAFQGSPVLFTQTRAGIEGHPFKLYKFRTMIDHADNFLDESGQPTQNRITPFGEFLRRSSVDELPQLINILKGDMSLVGPRPVLPNWVERFPQKSAHARFRVPPGLTGMAQIQGRNTLPWSRRLELDAAWAQSPTIMRYLTILFATPLALLKPTVSYDRNADAVDDLPKAGR